MRACPLELYIAVPGGWVGKDLGGGGSPLPLFQLSVRLKDDTLLYPIEVLYFSVCQFSVF